MRHTQKTKLVALVGAVLMSISQTPSVCAVPNAFDDFVTEVTSESSSEYIFTINAYSPEDGSYLSGMKLEIRNGNGNVVTLKKRGNSFVRSSGGIESIETDETGGATLKLPEGVYTVYPYSSSRYEPAEVQIKIEVSGTTQGDSIDIEYYPATIKQTTLNFVDNSGNAVQGGEFEIIDAFGEPVNFFNSNDILVYTSGNSGKSSFSASISGIVLSDLPDGTYKVSMLSVPAGYSADADGKKFTVTNGQADVTMTFRQSSTSMTVSNLDKNEQYLTNSGFSVTDSSGTVLNFIKLSSVEYVLSDTGTVNVIAFEEKAPVLLTGLKGDTEYTVSEINITPGYVPAEPQKITLKEGEQGNVVIQNKNPAGTLVFSVVDDQSSENIEGASLTVKNGEGNRLYFSSIVQGDLVVYTYDENGSIGECKTGKDGKARITGIPEGHVEAEIAELPGGYTASTEAIPVDILPNETLEKEIRVFKSNAVVDIRDENGNPVEGVEVSVYKDTGESVLTQKTNEQGKILLSGLDEGGYSCLISSVPETYSFDDEVRKFNISSNGLAESLSPITLKKIKVVVSIGSSNGTNAMDNAVFALYNGTGEELSRALTNTSGSAYFSGLTRGEYTIKEISAPVGYKISDFELSFTVDEKYKNGDTVDFSKGGAVSYPDSEKVSDPDDDHTSSEEDTSSDRKKMNISDLFMIIIGVLVVLFIAVSILSIVLKAKENKKGSSASVEVEDQGTVKEKPVPTRSIFEGKSPEEIEEIRRQLELYYTNNNDGAGGR